MSKRKKKWGDRRDGVWLKDIPAMNRIMPTLMPNRADNEAYINVDIDTRPLNAYLEKLNEGRTEDKYTFFHLISAAIGKAFILRPRMNRFIVGGKMYQRHDVTVAFTVKKKFDDKAHEALAFFTYDPKDTLETYHEKIMAQIHLTKSDDQKDTSTGAMDIITKLPQWLLHRIVKFVLWLDKHGWAPQSLIGSAPNHAAVFLTNLGSIGLEWLPSPGQLGYQLLLHRHWQKAHEDGLRQGRQRGFARGDSHWHHSGRAHRRRLLLLRHRGTGQGAFGTPLSAGNARRRAGGIRHQTLIGA